MPEEDEIKLLREKINLARFNIQHTKSELNSAMSKLHAEKEAIEAENRKKLDEALKSRREGVAFLKGKNHKAHMELVEITPTDFRELS